MRHNIELIKTEVLSDNWYILKKITYGFTRKNGDRKQYTREAYDRGNGAVILLYNKETKKVLLTKQFRLPIYINGNPDGMLIEACAGLLDTNEPEDCIRREVEEETGFRINNIEKVFEMYMSPGSVTEILYFFIGSYHHGMKINEGGGIEDEEIEILELDIDVAIQMMYNGSIKDAKTIILLQHLKLQKIL